MPVVSTSFGEAAVEPSMVRAKAKEPSQPVRGRDDDLATIGRHLDQLLSGIGWVIVVEGAAGLGKSRLLQQAVTMAHRLSIRVGSGAAARFLPVFSRRHWRSRRLSHSVT